MPINTGKLPENKVEMPINIDAKASKQELRSLMLRKRNNMPAKALLALSVAIQQSLLAQPIWQQAQSVALYMPTKNEVCTNLLLEAAQNSSKAIYLPRVRDAKNGLMDFALCRGLHELSLGAYGIQEPNPVHCASCEFVKQEDCLYPKNFEFVESEDCSAKASCEFVKQEDCPSEASVLIAPPPDLFIIPGVAYDYKGRRLGFGGGYYDRFLASPLLRAHSKFIGLAYSFQIVDSIPLESWDQPVHALCTELGYITLKEGHDFI